MLDCCTSLVGKQLQGGWEADETVEAAAARETVEEAGVRGALEVQFDFCVCMPAQLRFNAERSA